MASNTDSDGKTVTVTTDEGHQIGFAMSELHAPLISGKIATGSANGAPPGKSLTQKDG